MYITPAWSNSSCERYGQKWPAFSQNIRNEKRKECKKERQIYSPGHQYKWLPLLAFHRLPWKVTRIQLLFNDLSMAL